MTFPKQIQNLIEAFERLPGVGPKTAERLAFYLLHVPQPELTKLSDAVTNLKEGVVLCSICKNISNKEVCEICDDTSRDQTSICVVENPLDVFSLEKSGNYKGLYHVLHGVINPLNNIGPDELYIGDLLTRAKGKAEELEIILALNPTMEGEATALYIKDRLKDQAVRVSRLGVGLPIGGDMQYADATTLSRALEGRRAY